LKKDGSTDPVVLNGVVNYLRQGKLILMPVDCIYGIAAIQTDSSIRAISTLTGTSRQHVVRMVSSFRMLDEIAVINKFEYDFLHRVWPGELTVYLKSRKGMRGSIPVRFPRSRLQQRIIDMVGAPMIFAVQSNKKKEIPFRKNDIVRSFRNKVDLLFIIDEQCKEHPRPTVVDISSGFLRIIEEGRISAEEIKSLYFLGKDDVFR